jgi:hypothetical protein
MQAPAADYPVPDAKRMFTNDSSDIHRFVRDPYILDLAQTPKKIVAGEPTLFVFNLFDKSGQVWLWHSDMRIAVKDSSDKTILDFPNNHGHGSKRKVTDTRKVDIDLMTEQLTIQNPTGGAKAENDE